MCDDTLDVAALLRDRAAGIPLDGRIDALALALALESGIVLLRIAFRLCYGYPITLADAIHVLMAARQDYQDAASAIWRTTDGMRLPLPWVVRLRAMAPDSPAAATIRRQWRAGVPRDAIVHAVSGAWRGTAAG